MQASLPGAQRRIALATLAVAAVAPGLLWREAHAQLAALTDSDATAGLKGALESGAAAAVKLLGRQDGFWGNDRLRIPLPDWLRRAERALKLAGKGADVDALKVGINRAAEQAVVVEAGMGNLEARQRVGWVVGSALSTPASTSTP